VRRTRPSARIFNLVSGVPEWRSVRNAAAKTTTLYLYDEISWWGVTAADFVEQLQGVGGDRLNLHINSPGGDVWEGIAILNSLRQHAPGVDVTVDGLAASAASFIAMAGETVTMMKNSELMIHDAFGLVLGNAADMRDMAQRLDGVSDNIASVYAGRAVGDVAEWRDRMRAETWYSAEGAVAAGLADKVAGNGTEAAPENAWDLSIFDRAVQSESVAARLRPAGRGKAPAPAIPAAGPEEPTFDAEAFAAAMKEAMNA